MAKILASVAMLAMWAVAAAGRGFTVSETVDGSMTGRGWNGTWIAPGHFMFVTEHGDLFLADAENQTYDKLVSRSIMAKYNVMKIMFTASKGMIYNTDVFRDAELLMAYNTSSKATDNRNNSGYLTTSQYALYKIATRKFEHLAEGQRLQAFLPTSSGVVYAYVKDNDVYVRGGKEGVRITFDGSPRSVYNGVSDLLGLSADHGMRFSPKLDLLAFISIDATDVREEVIATYGHGRPAYWDIKYPKPGAVLPRVKISVVEVATKKIIREFFAPTHIVSKQHYLVHMAWVNNDELAMTWTNRVQNLAQLQICHIKDNKCEVIRRMHEPVGWLDLVSPLYEMGGKRVAMLLLQTQPDGERYPHIVLLERNEDGDLPTELVLTSGSHSVTKLYGWDADEGVIYFQATVSGSSDQRHVCSVTADENHTVICHSNNMVSPEGRPCSHGHVDFSPDLSHGAFTCGGPDPPYVQVMKIGSAQSNWTWELNSELRRVVAEVDMPTDQILKLQLPDSNVTARVRLLLPPGLDPNATQQYPMLFRTYSAPGTSVVNSAFSIHFGTHLATERNVIYATIDARGSDLMGASTMFSVYHRLGDVDVDDQITATKMLVEKFPFIDATRICVWGWSYGGYVAARILLKDDTGTFNCAMLVAPIVSWFYHSAEFTERLMGLPLKWDNGLHYKEGDVAAQAMRMRGKRLLLQHGTADRRVLYQHSMVLSAALQQAGVPFQQRSLVDRGHHLEGAMFDVYDAMDRFLLDCFDIEQNTTEVDDGAGSP